MSMRIDGMIRGDTRWARVWAYVRGPGLAAAAKAINRSEAFLAKVQARLVAKWRPRPEPEPEKPKQVPGNLRYSDLNLDSPEDALQALRRASRVPPHQRHLKSDEE